MKIAISGATGFVGSAATSCALHRGHTVVRILRPGSSKYGPDDICADLQDTESLSNIASQVDAAIHCAASDDPAFLPISEAASDALIKGLPEGGRFAMHSGSVVFGDTGPDAQASPAFAPPPSLEPKAAFDKRILNHDRPDVSTRIVYGSFIYGGQGAAIPSAMIRAALKTGNALFFDQGDQVWSTAHVSDFGALLVDAAECAEPKHVCLFAAGRAVRLKLISGIVGQVLGLPARPVRSEEEAALFGPFADALRINQHFSSRLARSRFRWYPDISDDGAAILRALTRHASYTKL